MQTLYYGGTILTMKSEQDYAEALITEDEKIVFAGSLTEAKKMIHSDTRLVSLDGHTLMPSFIDGHGHIMLAAQYADFADLSDCTSFEEIVQVLKQYKAEKHIGEEGVILGYGYDHNFLKEGTHPDKTILDQVSSTIPVYIFHSSGHMGVANTALLILAGITSESKNPAGGKYGRFPESSEPNGYLEETPALVPVILLCYSRLQIDMERNMLKIQDTYLSYGITTVQDGATSRGSAEQLIAIAEKGLLKLDIVSYIMASEDPAEFMKQHAIYDNRYHLHLKFAGAKIVLDGSPQGKSAWLSRPYENSGDYAGYPTLSDEEVNKYVSYCINHNLQLLAHCNGDAASEQFLNAYENAIKISADPEKKRLRPVMIHCQTVRNDQLKRMAALSMIPSIFIGHVYYWGDIHKKNLGEERAFHISPSKSALKADLMLNFHQDTPVTRPDMLHTVWCAVNRITRQGVILGEEERISVFEALQAVTSHSAYAYFEEQTKGTLEQGKLADLVILDKNPLSVPSMELNKIHVLETIKNGKTVYQV